MTIADRFLVTACTPRVHVRHLAVDGFAQVADFGRESQYRPGVFGPNEHTTHPLCGTGDNDSRYRFADEADSHLPPCRRCKARLCEYIENVQREGEAL